MAATVTKTVTVTYQTSSPGVPTPTSNTTTQTSVYTTPILAPVSFALSTLLPDFDDQLAQFRGILSGDVGTLTSGMWKDILVAGTGDAVLRFFSLVSTYNIQALELAKYELYLSTARQPSSIYSIMRNGGVRLQRYLPGSVQVILGRVDTSYLVRIPPYTQFTVGNQPYFNRTTIYIAPGVSTITVTIFQGTFITQTFVADGTVFQSYYLGNADFSTSDQDILCTIGSANTQWTRITDALYLYPSQNVYQDSTEIDGRVRIDFGDNVYGNAPANGQTITFSYIQINTAISTPQQPGLNVTANGFSTITGLTITSSTSYQAPRPPQFYQTMGPYLAASRTIVSNRGDFVAVALQYPGVIDAKFLGQAQTNPNDLREMCVVTVCLITTSPWALTDWQSFAQYMTGLCIPTIQFRWLQANIVTVNFSITLYVFNRANLVQVQQQAVNRINYLFTVQQGSLGNTYALSDIEVDLKTNLTDPYGKLVDIIDIFAPVQDISLPQFSYCVAGNININVLYTNRGVPIILDGVTTLR